MIFYRKAYRAFSPFPSRLVPLEVHTTSTSRRSCGKQITIKHFQVFPDFSSDPTGLRVQISLHIIHMHTITKYQARSERNESSPPARTTNPWRSPLVRPSALRVALKRVMCWEGVPCRRYIVELALEARDIFPEFKYIH